MLYVMSSRLVLHACSFVRGPLTRTAVCVAIASAKSHGSLGELSIAMSFYLSLNSHSDGPKTINKFRGTCRGIEGSSLLYIMPVANSPMKS